MMILHILSEDPSMLSDIANYLLQEDLVANTMEGEQIKVKAKSSKGEIEESTQYTLKAISKSLLFSTINDRLRAKYGDATPLIYSEPIILIDALHNDKILESITKV